jgi:hypothetical protein
MPLNPHKESKQDNVIHIGTIVRRPTGHVLVTSAGHLTLVARKERLTPWQDQRVVISGICGGPDTIEVVSIDEMMNEDEIRECASFILGRYRQHADQHVRKRVEAAIRCGAPRQVAIWQAISSRLTLLRGATASDAFLSTFSTGKRNPGSDDHG